MRRLLVAILLASSVSAQVKITGSTKVAGPLQISPLASASGGNVTLGETLENTTDNNQFLPLANLFTTPSGASGFTVNSVSIYQGIATSHTTDVGIYSTTGSPPVPNSRLCHTSTTGTWTVGFNTITLSGCGTLSASTVYALAFIDNLTTNNQGKAQVGAVGVQCPAAPQSQPNTVFSTTQGSAILPSSWGGSTTATTTCFSVNVNLTCVASCGNVPSNLTLIDMEGLSNGVTATSATLQHFNSCGGNITGVFNLNSGGSYSGYTGATAAQMPFVNAQSLCAVTSTASNSLGYDFATNTPSGGPFSNTAMKFLSSGNKASVLFPISWTFTNDAGHAYSNIVLTCDSGCETAMVQVTSGGIRLETATGSTSLITTATDGATYYVCLTFDGASGHNHTLSVFDNTGTSLGSVSRANNGTQVPNQLEIGITGGEAEVSGQHLRWDNVLLDPTGAFACTP